MQKRFHMQHWKCVPSNRAALKLLQFPIRGPPLISALMAWHSSGNRHRAFPIFHNIVFLLIPDSIESVSAWRDWTVNSQFVLKLRPYAGKPISTLILTNTFRCS